MIDVQEWEAYSLDEVVIKSGISERDLLRKAAAGKLAVWVWCGEKSPLLCLDGKYTGWFRIPPEFIPDIINGLEMCVDRLITEGGVEVLPANYDFENVVYRSKFMSVIPGSREPDPEMEAELVSWAIPTRKEDLKIFPDDLASLHTTGTIKNDNPDDDKAISEKDQIAPSKLVRGVNNMRKLVYEHLGAKVDRKTFKNIYFRSGATWELCYELRKTKPKPSWKGYDNEILEWAKKLIDAGKF